MAGRHPDGPGASAEFRAALRFVYEMAAPVQDGEQAVFYFPSQLIYNRSVDAEDVPFDPSATVTNVPPTPVKVLCGIEYQDAEGQAIVFGTVTASRLVISLLDEEYVRVQGASYVVVGGERYNYRRTEVPNALFDVGFYLMHFVAENEL